MLLVDRWVYPRCLGITDGRRGETGVSDIAAPKEWRSRFFEDFEAGDTFRNRLGRTITDSDNVWFTCLTLNTN
jgi:acyl dehydratase